jgi:hypothetical protein
VVSAAVACGSELLQKLPAYLASLGPRPLVCQVPHPSSPSTRHRARAAAQPRLRRAPPAVRLSVQPQRAAVQPRRLPLLDDWCARAGAAGACGAAGSSSGACRGSQGARRLYDLWHAMPSLQQRLTRRYVAPHAALAVHALMDRSSHAALAVHALVDRSVHAPLAVHALMQPRVDAPHSSHLDLERMHAPMRPHA